VVMVTVVVVVALVLVTELLRQTSRCREPLHGAGTMSVVSIAQR